MKSGGAEDNCDDYLVYIMSIVRNCIMEIKPRNVLKMQPFTLRPMRKTHPAVQFWRANYSFKRFWNAAGQSKSFGRQTRVVV